MSLTGATLQRVPTKSAQAVEGWVSEVNKFEPTQIQRTPPVKFPARNARGGPPPLLNSTSGPSREIGDQPRRSVSQPVPNQTYPTRSADPSGKGGKSLGKGYPTKGGGKGSKERPAEQTRGRPSHPVSQQPLNVQSAPAPVFGSKSAPLHSNSVPPAMRTQSSPPPRNHQVKGKGKGKGKGSGGGGAGAGADGGISVGVGVYVSGGGGGGGGGKKQSSQTYSKGLKGGYSKGGSVPQQNPELRVSAATPPPRESSAGFERSPSLIKGVGGRRRTPPPQTRQQSPAPQQQYRSRSQPQQGYLSVSQPPEYSMQSKGSYGKGYSKDSAKGKFKGGSKNPVPTPAFSQPSPAQQSQPPLPVMRALKKGDKGKGDKGKGSKGKGTKGQGDKGGKMLNVQREPTPQLNPSPALALNSSFSRFSSGGEELLQPVNTIDIQQVDVVEDVMSHSRRSVFGKAVSEVSKDRRQTVPVLPPGQQDGSISSQKRITKKPSAIVPPSSPIGAFVRSEIHSENTDSENGGNAMDRGNSVLLPPQLKKANRLYLGSFRGAPMTPTMKRIQDQEVKLRQQQLESDEKAKKNEELKKKLEEAENKVKDDAARIKDTRKNVNQQLMESYRQREQQLMEEEELHCVAHQKLKKDQAERKQRHRDLFLRGRQMEENLQMEEAETATIFYQRVVEREKQKKIEEEKREQAFKESEERDKKEREERDAQDQEAKLQRENDEKAAKEKKEQEEKDAKEKKEQSEKEEKDAKEKKEQTEKEEKDKKEQKEKEEKDKKEKEEAAVKEKQEKEEKANKAKKSKKKKNQSSDDESDDSAAKNGKTSKNKKKKKKKPSDDEADDSTVENPKNKKSGKKKKQKKKASDDDDDSTSDDQKNTKKKSGKKKKKQKKKAASSDDDDSTSDDQKDAKKKSGKKKNRKKKTASSDEDDGDSKNNKKKSNKKKKKNDSTDDEDDDNSTTETVKSKSKKTKKKKKNKKEKLSDEETSDEPTTKKKKSSKKKKPTVDTDSESSTEVVNKKSGKKKGKTSKKNKVDVSLSDTESSTSSQETSEMPKNRKKKRPEPLSKLSKALKKQQRTLDSDSSQLTTPTTATTAPKQRKKQKAANKKEESRLRDMEKRLNDEKEMLRNKEQELIRLEKDTKRQEKERNIKEESNRIRAERLTLEQREKKLRTREPRSKRRAPSFKSQSFFSDDELAMISLGSTKASGYSSSVRSLSLRSQRSLPVQIASDELILTRGLSLPKVTTSQRPPSSSKDLNTTAPIQSYDSAVLWNRFDTIGRHPVNLSYTEMVKYCGTLGFSKVESLCITAMWCNTVDGSKSVLVGSGMNDSPNHPLASSPTNKSQFMNSFPIGNGASYSDIPSGSDQFNQIAAEVVSTCDGLSSKSQLKIIRIVEANCNDEVTSRYLKIRSNYLSKTLYYNPLEKKPFLDLVLNGLTSDLFYSTRANARVRPGGGQSICFLLCEAALGKCKPIHLPDKVNSDSRVLLKKALKQHQNLDTVSGTFTVPNPQGSCLHKHFASRLGALPRYLVHAEIQLIESLKKAVEVTIPASEELDYLQGIYREAGSYRDFPYFSKGEARLFVHGRGGWMFAETEEQMTIEEGIAASGSDYGKAAHEVKKWLASNGKTWVDQKIIVKQIKGSADNESEMMTREIVNGGKEISSLPDHSLISSNLLNTLGEGKPYVYGTPIAGYGLWQWSFRITHCSGEVGFGIGIGEWLRTELTAPISVTVRLSSTQTRLILSIYKIGFKHTTKQMQVSCWSPTELVFPQVLFLESGTVYMAEHPQFLQSLD